MGFILLIGLLIFSVVLHECAHGFVAERKGDPTARLMGRITLNPIKHIDLLGTIIVPVFFYFIGAPIVGWAKPVPVDFRRLRHPKQDMIWVALAGPASNLILAVVFALLSRLVGHPKFVGFCYIAIFINLLIAVFNLTPIPPLDGSRILMGLLPSSWARAYARLEPWGFFIVIVLLNLGLLNFIWVVVVLLAMFLGVDPRGLTWS